MDKEPVNLGKSECAHVYGFSFLTNDFIDDLYHKWDNPRSEISYNYCPFCGTKISTLLKCEEGCCDG